MVMKPVFIFGVNRSGTHLLMSLFSGHSRLFVTGLEDHLISGVGKAGGEFQSALKSGRVDQLYRFLFYYTRYPLLALSHFYKTFEASHSNSYNTKILWPFDFQRFEEDFLGKLCQGGRTIRVSEVETFLQIFYETLAEHCGEKGKSSCITKSAGNVEHFMRARKYLPNLKPRLICLVRDPRAVLASSIQSKSMQCADSEISRLAEAWARHLWAAKKLAKDYPLKMVRYEDLCLNPEQEMRNLCQWLEIPFEEVLLRPTLWGEVFVGNSSFESHQGGIGQSSVERWKKTLSQKQVEKLEARLLLLMRKSGYAPSRARPATFLKSCLFLGKTSALFQLSKFKRR